MVRNRFAPVFRAGFRSRVGRRVGLAAAAAVTMLAMPALPAAQIEAGALATWGDLSTWSRPAAGTTSLTETGLGLVLAGDQGEMRLAFFVVRANRGAAASRPPTEIGVRAAAGARVNPNLMRTPTLSFTFGDRGDDQPEFVDLSEKITVDNPAPGAPVASAVGAMAVDAFVEMSEADEVRADIFGAQVTFRADQIAALQAFAERVLPRR